MTTPVRLQRYLATAGVAARRKAEELIVEGRVKVNGKVVTVLGTKVDPDNDSVLVDGEAVAALDHFYVLFNKPKGCITAVTDDRGRPTVMDYLPNLPVPVKPVGRLDFYTEGVLLLTNDGELAARLLAPGNHVPKTYHVKVHGRLGKGGLEALREGVPLDDGTTTMPAEVEILPGESKHTWLGITIHEGKHRQIHRMLEALGYQVDKLQRVAFANLTFHDLRVGDARELTQQELNALRDIVGLDHRAVARGRWRAEREATDIPRRARAKARAEQEAEAMAAGHAPDPQEAWDDHDPDAGEEASGGVRTDSGRDQAIPADSSGRSQGEIPAGRSGRSWGGGPAESSGRSQGGGPAKSSGRSQGGIPAGRSGRSRGVGPTESGGRSQGGIPAGRSGRSWGGGPAESSGRSWGGGPTESSGRSQGGIPAGGSGRSRGGGPAERSGRSRDGGPAERSGRSLGGIPAGRSGRSRGGGPAGSSVRTWGGGSTGSERGRGGGPTGSGGRSRGGGSAGAGGRGRPGGDRAAAPRSPRPGGSFGPTRPRPARGAGEDRGGDRASPGGRWERRTDGAGARDRRAGSGRRPDDRRADRDREAPRPRDAGAAEGRSGRRSRDDTGAGSEGQGRSFGPRPRPRGRNK